ncbi:MAG TPA: UbiA family prenyltransferase [Dokdonella sp.]
MSHPSGATRRSEPTAVEVDDRDVPLCVDLDGTLLRSDVLVESALCLLRRNPLYALRFAGWLLRGKANLKRQIAARAALDVTLLPYEARVLEWLRGEAAPRRRVLCSAADQTFVDAVAAHVGCFDEAFGSDGRRNLAGARKGEALAARYGERGFDYAGNSSDDLHVWRRARRAVVVNARGGIVRRARGSFDVERVFERDRRAWRAWPRALRLHQWLKNLLVFLPLLTAHLVLSPPALAGAAIAFLSLSVCASGTYVLNDLLDLEADRRHPRKRERPFASGALPLPAGFAAAPALILTGFALAFAWSPPLAAVLLGYCALTLTYSFALKRVAMLDVVALAALYTIRIIAGAVAIGVGVSFWLLAFSMFLFLSLAMVKRYTELRMLLSSGQSRASGRGYAVDDLPLVQALGAASGYLSVLVFALYINSTASEALYRHPPLLWLLCPLLLYWISRIWLVAHRGEMHDDPVVFAITDRVSGVVLALCAAAVIAAI